MQCKQQIKESLEEIIRIKNVKKYIYSQLQQLNESQNNSQAFKDPHSNEENFGDLQMQRFSAYYQKNQEKDIGYKYGKFIILKSPKIEEKFKSLIFLFV